MKRTARLVVCALATLALLGVGNAAQAFTSHGHGSGHTKPHHHRRLEQDGSSHLLRALGRLDRRLVHATSVHRLAPLTVADRDALQSSAELDEAAVGAVATAYSSNPAADTEAAVLAVLHGYRAERYLHATNILRHSERTAARIVALQPQVVAGSADDTALQTAAALLAGVPASGFNATSTHADLQAARHAVAQARALVDQVQGDVATP